MNNEVNPNNNVNTNSTQNTNVQGVVSNNQVPVNTVSNAIEELTPSNNTVNTNTTNNVEQLTPNGNVVSNTGNYNTEQINNDVPINNTPMKEVVINPEPPKKGKYVMTFILFVGLLLMVWFLPEISSYINILKQEKNTTDEKITTGVLKCTLTRTSENFDITYSQNFDFTDSKLNKLTYSIETKGDMNIDEDELDEMNTKCSNISSIAKGLAGISVTCDLTQGTMTETHVFNYAELKTEEATSLYSEAGGVFPEYEYQQDIDAIEKNKYAEGFSCQRAK